MRKGRDFGTFIHHLPGEGAPFLRLCLVTLVPALVLYFEVLVLLPTFIYSAGRAPVIVHPARADYC